MKRFSRYLLFGFLLLGTWQIAPCQNMPKPTEKPLNQPGEDAAFQRYLNSGRISVVAFYANWCPSCRSWSPFLDAVNTYFPDMQVLFMDIREWDSPVTEKYEFSSIPHFKIYDRDARLIVEGPAADDWLRQAIRQRLEARARGAYRLSGESAKLEVRAGSRSVSTKPKGNGRGRSVPTAAAAPAREKIESTGPLPTIDQIVERYIAALGGPKAQAKFMTLSAKGKVSVSNIGRGSFITYMKAPNKMVMTIDIPEMGVLSQGYNGVRGWSRLTESGRRRGFSATLSPMKRHADFLGFLKIKANYPQLRVLGTAKIGFREAYVVEARATPSQVEKFYFSKENGLIIRCDEVTKAYGTTVSSEMYLDDWTDVEGIKMPFTITQLFPQLSVVFIFDEIKPDIQIADSVFNAY